VSLQKFGQDFGQAALGKGTKCNNQIVDWGAGNCYQTHTNYFETCEIYCSHLSFSVSMREVDEQISGTNVAKIHRLIIVQLVGFVSV